MTRFSTVEASDRAAKKTELAPTATFTGTLELAAPTYGRPLAFGQGGVCNLSGVGSAVHYKTFQFTLAAPSNVTISTAIADGATISPAGADTFLILYGPGAFNPAAGCTNAIAANDDVDGGSLSRITTTTPLGVGTYTFVVTSFDNTPASPGAFPWSYTGFSSVPVLGASPVQHVLDFNGDGKTDFSVTRNTGGGPNGQLTWFNCFNGVADPACRQFAAFGLATDFVVPADYDGDGKSDIAVWRPGASGVAAFYILQSQTNTVRTDVFGQNGDDPTVVADYTGDGKADAAVYRIGASPGQQSFWYYRASNGPFIGLIVYEQWGFNNGSSIGGDFAAPGDYDGDGKSDFMVQRDNGGGSAIFWLRTNGTNNVTSAVWGNRTDTVVPGDYDGDGKTDIAVARFFIGGAVNWYVRRSTTPSMPFTLYSTFGLGDTDFPVQGDYDGDGKTDVAVWRPNADPSANFFYYSGSTSGFTAFEWGQNGDYPNANAYTH